MNEFEKYINKVETDYVKANPKQSDWSRFSNRLSSKNNGVKFLSGVFLIGLFTISYFIINSDEPTSLIIQKDKIVDLGFNDSIIIRYKGNSVNDTSIENFVDNSLDEKNKISISNVNSIEYSEIDSSNLDLENKMSLKTIDVKLESEISTSNLKLNLNKSYFCQNDTLKASYFVSGIEYLEDSILSVQWLFNNNLYATEVFKTPVNKLQGDVEGSLIIETLYSMIKKDFMIHVYETNNYEITLVENPGLKKSVEIKVDGLKNMICEVNGVKLIKGYNGFEYEFYKPGEIIFSVKGEDLNGCNVSLHKAEKIQQTFNLYSPTAFTPNDDGLNSVFMPAGIKDLNLPFEMIIYNEKGAEVFKTQNPNNAWDGKTIKGTIEQGVYIWKLEINNKGIMEYYNGKIVLIK